VTIYLVRHAHAGSRHDWPGDDTQRPLSRKGRRQARAIKDVVAERGVARVLSSPSVRCQQTVDPLALQCGVDVEVIDSLDEGTPLDESMALLRSAFDTEVALCSHGDVIPDLLRALDETGTAVHGRRHPAKGSLYVLDVDGDRVISATYVEPSS